MDPVITPEDEVRLLADRLFDGHLEAMERVRLESLILADQRCLQIYCERLDFHCELISQADAPTSEAAILAGLQKFSQAADIRKQRRLWKIYGILTTAVLGMMVLVGWSYRGRFAPAPVGVIASLTTDLSAPSASLELGQAVRPGQTVTLAQGIASVQLADVMVDLIGPATMSIRGKKEVVLSEGTIVAKVSSSAIGFKVRTEDAEVIDLGTEFLVQAARGQGTSVSVRRGAVQAKLLDQQGKITKMMDLTASRSARFDQTQQVIRETDFSPQPYLRVDRSRGGICRLTGAIRCLTELPASLASNQTTTPDHLLILPEQQIILPEAQTYLGISGPVTIPAGSTLSSYLIHYDPTETVHFAPRGSVTFDAPIAAILVSHESLRATDARFGVANLPVEQESFRQLELEEDEIRISDDRKTVSFFFGVSPPEFLDEARILVIHP